MKTGAIAMEISAVCFRYFINTSNILTFILGKKELTLSNVRIHFTFESVCLPGGG